MNFLLKEKHFSALNRRFKKFIKILESRKENWWKISEKEFCVCEKKRVKKKKKVKCTKDPHSLVYQKNSHSKKWVKNSQNIPLPKFFSLSWKMQLIIIKITKKERTKISQCFRKKNPFHVYVWISKIRIHMEIFSKSVVFDIFFSKSLPSCFLKKSKDFFPTQIFYVK